MNRADKQEPSLQRRMPPCRCLHRIHIVRVLAARGPLSVRLPIPRTIAARFQHL